MAVRETKAERHEKMKVIKWRALKLNSSWGVKLGERGRGSERVKLVIIWTWSQVLVNLR